jgi:DNA-binding XRE family transcriptional regulator
MHAPERCRGEPEMHMATHKWNTIKSKMAPERRARVDAAVRRELLQMDLRELREEAGKTQAEVAEIAETTQAELSKIERREDHLLSTLRRYATALGGELEVVAVFDNKRIALKGV